MWHWKFQLFEYIYPIRPLPPPPPPKKKKRPEFLLKVKTKKPRSTLKKGHTHHVALDKSSGPPQHFPRNSVDARSPPARSTWCSTPSSPRRESASALTRLRRNSGGGAWGRAGVWGWPGGEVRGEGGGEAEGRRNSGAVQWPGPEHSLWGTHIGVLFGCFSRQIDGDSWFTRWFNHLPGPSICPKRTPMVTHLETSFGCGSKPMGSHLGVGASPILVYFSGIGMFIRGTGF